MKKLPFIILLLVSSKCVEAQRYPIIDSIVIQLGIDNETEKWNYRFSISEKEIHVQGTDYYLNCFDPRVGTFLYYEEKYRKFVLLNNNLINPNTNNSYINEILTEIESVPNLKDIRNHEQESTYDTVWHITLYKNGDSIGYYYFVFDDSNSYTHNQVFDNIYSILRQIKMYCCY